MKTSAFRVALIGPESSGKSALCKALSEAFGCPCNPEYAREYLEGHGPEYTQNDVENMLREQILRENTLLSSNPKMVISDTEAINFKVWIEHVFGETPIWIDEEIAENPYNLYLLTASDLPYEADPLRENPGKGEHFFNWYKMILDAFGLKYVVISGSGSARTESAIKAVSEASGMDVIRK